MSNGNRLWCGLKIAGVVLGVLVSIGVLLAGPIRFGSTQVEHGVTIQQHEVRLTSGEAKDNELDGKCQSLEVSMAAIQAQVGSKIDELKDIMEDVRDRLPSK